MRQGPSATCIKKREESSAFVASANVSRAPTMHWKIGSCYREAMAHDSVHEECTAFIKSGKVPSEVNPSQITKCIKGAHRPEEATPHRGTPPSNRAKHLPRDAPPGRRSSPPRRSPHQVTQSVSRATRLTQMPELAAPYALHSLKPIEEGNRKQQPERLGRTGLRPEREKA